MRSPVRGLAAAALALLAFSLSALSEPASESPPNGVLEAVAAAQAPESPAKVAVGAYINDIQELDFKTNSYAVDLYVWFRWKPSDLDPSKTMEFMNRYDPNDHERDELYDKPKQMPDGSLYAIVRNQGRFSTKFQLGDYPFDTQFLTVVMEDTISSEDTQVYVPDPTGSIGLDPEITLPGFKVGKPEMRIVSNTYPTNFGDLAEPQGDTYSRVVLSVPVTRPLMAMSVKTFVPIVLIVICAALVFFVRPHYVEGRIGLGITALLTLVALQLTSSASLPDVDYLMMLDKIYLLAYVFIIAALARVVLTSWRGADEAAEKSITRADRIWVSVLLAAYLAANAAVVLPALV
jgi:hypothetical protein